MASDGTISVVHVNGSDSGGGAEIQAYALHRELLRLGHTSRMYVGRKVTEDPTVTQLPWARGIPGLKRLANRLERRFGWQYLYSPRFRNLLALLPADLDLLHVHSLYGAEGYADIGALPKLSRRFPMILSLHDMWMLTGHCGYNTGCPRWLVGCGNCPDLSLPFALPRDGTRLNLWRKRWAVPRTLARVTACSEWLACEVRRSPVFRGKTVHAVLNAIDTSVFTPGGESYPLDSPKDGKRRLVVLVAANSLANPWKGARDAIEALNAVGGASVSALLVGHAPELGSALSVTHQATGYIADRKRMATVYRAADVLLMPSTEEAFGLVAAEAMACGTPVIAYASGGLPEVIGDGGAGVLVAKGDVGGLVAALGRLVAHPEEATSMGQRAVRRASERFSLARYAQQMVDLYQLVIAERSTGL